MTTLRKGSKGSEVIRLQTLLNITADGIFGNKTRAAVIEYQKAHNLTADGIVGTRTWAVLLGGADPVDIVIHCEDIKQFASPHGTMTYGPDGSYSTYKSGGCGVTSFAIVQRAYGLAPEGETATETVQRLGRYAWEHGYRIKNAGTNAGLFGTNDCRYSTTKSMNTIEDAIRSGNLVILNIEKGFPNGYTGKGHYIVAYGIKDDVVLLRDVGSSAASRQKASLLQITKGLKNAYIIRRKG